MKARLAIPAMALMTGSAPSLATSYLPGPWAIFYPVGWAAPRLSGKELASMRRARDLVGARFALCGMSGLNERAGLAREREQRAIGYLRAKGLAARADVAPCEARASDGDDASIVAQRHRSVWIAVDVAGMTQ